ncbi:TPA: transporter substrate-binding domain-containing protein [Burkholderia cenocepacia]|uniref:lysine/arginine/ornithine ABC transporter substrate-binding protein n=1 Tax=unclassified Burkholderia TaxID=2613784 RepID=UPI00158E8703|nr:MULTISPECIES: lysine/arginine/ornithine ABC transporter substrate-binding protein [unclassified Burkholderia]HEF5875068.1 transporter substrate-binding domain-containing protein [Burkholderia cenocepacia]
MRKRHLLAVSLLAIWAASAHADNWTTVRFGAATSYPPFHSQRADGRLAGFDIDLGDEICRRMHVRCVWVESDFDSIIPALEARKFDGILSALSITPERAEQIAFSSKLYDIPSRLVARKDSGLLPTPASLKGERVGVVQGSTQERYAQTFWAPEGVTVVSYDDQQLVYADLLEGRLAATLTNAAQAEYGFLNTAAGAGYAFAGEPLSDPDIFGVGTAVGLRKQDTDLKARIDRAIAAMLADGTYRKIASKYFSFDVYGN